MTKEALTLALEALEASARNWPSDSVIEAITAIKEALSTKCVAQPEKTVCPFCSSEWVTAEQHDRKMDRMEQERCVGCEACIDTACGRDECPKGWPKAAQPEQEPVAWKLVPIKPTREMLRAMDECSTEGYDERLYAGHAASVYMAAVDVAPNPPEARNQEPVAWLHTKIEGVAVPHRPADLDKHPDRWTALYKDPKPCPTCEALARTVMLDQTSHDTTPPQRKPLTDQEIGAILEGVNAYGTRLYTFARAIEAKLKEKNT